MNLGRQIPLVLIPRYTTLAGNAADWTTVGIDVTPYDSAKITVWRGEPIGTLPTPATDVALIWFEESTDQTAGSWTACEQDPSAGGGIETNDQTLYSVVFAKRWFRIRVRLHHATNVVSFYAAGLLQERLR